MIRQEEFEAAIESFLMEMSAICAAKSERELRAIPGFYAELQESAALMRDPATDTTSLLSLSFGVIDEFVEKNRAEVMRECYEFYMDTNGRPRDRDGKR